MPSTCTTAAGVLQANVSFGASPAGPSFPTFDNAAGLNNAAISQLSVAGVNGAFVAANDANEIGSPGTIAPALSVIISEVSPWSSGNSPYAADWFEVTNTGAPPWTSPAGRWTTARTRSPLRSRSAA